MNITKAGASSRVIYRGLGSDCLHDRNSGLQTS